MLKNEQLSFWPCLHYWFRKERTLVPAQLRRHLRTAEGRVGEGHLVSKSSTFATDSEQGTLKGLVPFFWQIG